jgi:hypothetical protein
LVQFGQSLDSGHCDVIQSALRTVSTTWYDYYI